MRGIEAYKKTEQVIASPRDSEAKVILAVNKGLERFAEEGPQSPSLKDYLLKNQRLWVAVRQDTASEGNSLPAALRAQLVSLSIWVEKHTIEVLKGAADVRDLIEVNNSLIGGLAGQAQPSSVGA